MVAALCRLWLIALVVAIELCSFIWLEMNPINHQRQGGGNYQLVIKLP